MRGVEVVGEGLIVGDGDQGTIKSLKSEGTQKCEVMNRQKWKLAAYSIGISFSWPYPTRNTPKQQHIHPTTQCTPSHTPAKLSSELQSSARKEGGRGDSLNGGPKLKQV